MPQSVFRWTGQVSGDFGTAGNWYDVTTGATSTVVPSVNGEALVTATGGLGGTLDVFELALTGTGAQGLGPYGNLQARLAYLAGTVSFYGSTLFAVQSLLDIGDGASGPVAGSAAATLTVNSTNEVDVVATSQNAGGLVVGQSGGNGTLVTISQSNALAHAIVLTYAYGGSTALTVGGSSAVGLVQLNGFASALGVYGRALVGNGGTGTIEVNTSARLAAGADASNSGLTLGLAGGTGSLILDVQSQASLLGETVVGANGTGTLSVSQGSGLVAQSTTGPALLAGAAVGGNGTVFVTDPYSFASFNGAMEIGGLGTGAMAVQNGARVQIGNTASPTTPALSVGVATGGTGTVTVASQAELIALGAGIDVGDYGSGVLNVSSANVTVTTAAAAYVSALDVGVMAGSTGAVNVSGGLIFDSQAAGMFVGFGGSGTMTIAEAAGQGGLVLTGDPLAGAGFSLGVNAGSDGSLSITGSASGLGVYGTVADGLSGHGSVSVTDGGHLIATLGRSSVGLTLGGAGGAGAMTVDSGAQVYVLGQTIIGTKGTGTLSITGGSSFTGTVGFPTTFYQPLDGQDAAMLVGDSSTATGSVLISDLSTYVPLTGGLVLGESGQGSMAVTNGAILSVSGTLYDGLSGVILGDQKGASGTLTLSDHATMTSSFGVEVGGFGTGELDVSGATLTIDNVTLGAALSIRNDFASGPSSVTLAGGLIVAGGGVAVQNGMLTIEQSGGQGGTLITGNGSFSGLTVGTFNYETASVSVSGAASGIGVFGGTSIYHNATMTISAGARLVTGYTGDTTYSFEAGLNVGGTLSMAGAAEASVLGQSVVGGFGSLSIIGGSGFTGHATNGAALVVADGAFAPATVLLSDATSYASLSGGLVVGNGTDGAGGPSGSAIVTVADGALMVVSAYAANATAVSIGNVSSGDTLAVDGNGSRLVDSGFFQVGGSGQDGTGNLIVSGGGSLSVGTLSGQTGPAAMIGNAAGLQGASSAVTVTGTGSDWSIGGTLLVAGNPFGSATLDVAAGGLVSADEVVVDDTANGVITVENVGSALNATSLVVAAGTLVANGGGVFHASNGIALGGAGGAALLSGGTLATATTVSLSVGADLTGVGGSSVVSASSIVNLGNISAAGGTLSCLGTITGSGLITMNGGKLVLGNGEAAGVGIEFSASGGTLAAQNAAEIAGTITGWAPSDFIDLQNAAATSESFASGTLSLFGANTQLVGKLLFSGALTSSNFTLSALAGGGTVIGYHS